MDWGFILTQTMTQAIGITAIIYILAAIGLNVQFGYAGLLNFGQVMFVAAGSYAVGVIVLTFDLSLWLSILVAIVVATLLALLLGIPTLRLRADYLAIVTIAASELFRLSVRSIAFKDTLGGAQGLNGKLGQQFHDTNPLPADFQSLPVLSWTRQDLWVVIVGWLLVAAFTFLVWLLVRSPWGRVVKGIREDEDAVVSLGKNVFVYKMQALILGGVVGALAGVIFAMAAQSVQPDNYSTTLTFYVYVIVILGGAARVFGPIVGSMVFWFLLVFISELLNNAVLAGYISSDLLST
ncbi:MAG: branched-chain amino acid ABC transporter permease, partial [Candidatus Nanopelagicales bacterium]